MRMRLSRRRSALTLAHLKGAPVDLTPTVDNLVIANDPAQNNNFDYSHAGFDITSDQSHCPFSPISGKSSLSYVAAIG